MQTRFRSLIAGITGVCLLPLLFFAGCNKANPVPTDPLVEPIKIPLPEVKIEKTDFNIHNPWIKKAMEIQERHNDALVAENEMVIGTALGRAGDGRIVIKVLLDNPPQIQNNAALPQTIENLPVVYDNVGTISSQHSAPETDLTSGDSSESSQIVLYAGSSIGNANECNSGTFGMIYQGNILSNNHVIARQNRARIGERLVTPGLYDVNCQPNSVITIGSLAGFEEIIFNIDAANRWDWATARPASGIKLSNQVRCGGYTIQSSIANAYVGQEVKKCGRTTGYTTGIVTGLNTITKIDYPNKVQARFIRQVQFSKMSEYGDSGSVIVDKRTNRPVALLFAGSSAITLGNPL